MPTVHFTTALQRFFPNLETTEVAGQTVAEVIQLLNEQYPNLADYIIDEQGELRKHVNIYIGEELLQDREKLEDKVSDMDEILIFQALSGG